jgi:hypothetical protein
MRDHIESIAKVLLVVIGLSVVIAVIALTWGH